MQKFINLEHHNEPETTMFPQETALLQELIQGVLEKAAPKVTRGTFILDGQKFGEEAKCLLRFNLSEGNFRRRFFRIYEKTSDRMAEESIDEMLAIPGESRYIRRSESEKQAGYQMTNNERSMTNGVYRDGELIVLVLNATHGRFLMTCHLDEPESDNDNATAAELVLYAVAQAIAKMGKEDITLQHSDRFIYDFAKDSVGGYAKIRQHIDDMFETGTGLAMMAWKAWHEPANASGDLTLFFE